MGTRSVHLWVLVAALLIAGPAGADEAAPDLREPVTVILKDGGGRVVGTIVAEDEAAIVVKTAAGPELRIVRESIASIEPGKRPDNGSSLPADPNDTRLMFAPTGRPLGKGDGYVSDHYVVFPGFGYGLTKNLSFGGGFSTVPYVGLHQQVFYVSAQAGFRTSEKAAFSFGGFYAATPFSGEDDLGAAIGYGMTTFGRPDRSLTLGLALASVRDYEDQFDSRGRYLGTTPAWRSEPIVLVGGSARVARRLSLVSENWLFVSKPLSESAFGLAMRFFSDRISVDAGFVFVPEAIDEGFPIPWLSFSYHFGPSRSKANRVAGPPMGLDRRPRAH